MYVGPTSNRPVTRYITRFVRQFVLVHQKYLSLLHTLSHTVFFSRSSQRRSKQILPSSSLIFFSQKPITMTDTTDDIAEEISFQSFEDDCKLLGSLFNDVLQREVGTDFMEKIERTRVLAQVFCFLFDFTLCFRTCTVLLRSVGELKMDSNE